MQSLSRATELELGSLDVSVNQDQKTLVNRVLCNNGKEPINRLTNDKLEKHVDTPEVCLALDFRRVTKAIGQVAIDLTVTNTVNFKTCWDFCILAYNNLFKVDLDSYKSLTKNGRIHPTINYFNLTGRITMDRPGLQMVQNPFSLKSKPTKEK